jgi:hypothetical protein
VPQKRKKEEEKRNSRQNRLDLGVRERGVGQRDSGTRGKVYVLNAMFVTFPTSHEERSLLKAPAL